MFLGNLRLKPFDVTEMADKEVMILDNSLVGTAELSFILFDDWKSFREIDRRIQNTCHFLYTNKEQWTPMYVRREILIIN